MAPRLIPIRSGNHAGASSRSRRPHRRILSLERLDERILLSSSPTGGVTGPIVLAPAQPTQVAAVKPGATVGLQSGISTSTNWSGYIAEPNLGAPQAGSVTAVTGSWVVPTVTGIQGTSSDSSVWVGIDGYNGSTVEQVGTEQDVVNGLPTYRAWWEMYSTGAQQPEQVITGMTISPGDSISASVQYMTSGDHAGQFLLLIIDNSRSNDYFFTYASSSAYQNPLAQRSTAEWVVEAPTNGLTKQVDELANFGTVTFTNATAEINGQFGPINSARWQSTQVNMVNGVTEASTSALSGAPATGTSFSVSYALDTILDVAGTLYTLQNGNLYTCPAGQSNWSLALSNVTSFAKGNGPLWGNAVYALESNGELFQSYGGSNSFVQEGSGIVSFAFGNGYWVNELYALASNGVLYQSTGNGFVPEAGGIVSFAFGSGLWVNDLYALASNGNLYQSTGNGFVQEGSGIVSFAFGNGLWANDLYVLTSDGGLYQSTGNGFVPEASGITSFAFGNGLWINDLYALASNGDLYQSTGNGFTQEASGIVSFAFGNGYWVNELYALASNGNLYQSTGNGFVQEGSGIVSFAFGSGLWVNDLYALASNGDLYQSTGNGFVQEETGVTSFAFGTGPGANALVVRLSNGQLDWDTGSGFQPEATGVSSFAFSADNRVFYLGTNGNLYAFTPGGSIAQQTGGYDVESFAMRADGRVYFLNAADQSIYAFTEGGAITRQTIGFDVESFTMRADGRIYFLNAADQSIYAFTEGGAITRQTPALYHVKSFAMTAGDRIYFLNGPDQSIYAFTEGGPIVQQTVSYAIKSFILGPGNQVFFLGNGNAYSFIEGQKIVYQIGPVVSLYEGSGGTIYATKPNGSLWQYTPAGWVKA